MSKEKESKKITLEQAKLFRFFLRVAFFLIAFATPCILIAAKFNLFTKSTTGKWSIAGIVMLVIVAWRFKKKIAEWINSWEDSNIFKWILVAVSRVWPFALIVALVFVIHYSANDIIGKILTCLEWTAFCEVIAYLFLFPVEMKMDYLVKRMVRRNERVADYKEAINEMKQEEKGE